MSLEALLGRWADFNALDKAGSLMAWDRQVLMPPGGASARTEHSGRLAKMAHEVLVSDETRRLVDLVEASGDSPGVVRVLRRELSARGSLPSELVERKSRVASDAYEAWKAARASSDFSILQPFLSELFEIGRETAERRGYEEHVYDALIDLFEEGATTALATRLLGRVKEASVSLINEVREEQAAVDDSSLTGSWDASLLRSMMQEITAQIGFDYGRGRLDVCSNAFCSNFSCGDVRMTTRHASTLKGIVFSSLHEMGHGVFEQGSPALWDRTPLAGGVSMAVHESQSRLWENIVGRSLPFWRHFFPLVQSSLPGLEGVSSEGFYRAVSKLSPGPVRIGSDEVTYNLHIALRFELECDVLTGSLAVRDLPDAWNAKTESYLGLTPANDAEGILQDVHWSRGMYGYFPTYTFGNLLGWQFWSCLQADLGDTSDLISKGDFAPTLGWLTEKIYSQGKQFAPSELVQRVVGEPISAEPFIEAMREKYLGVS